MFRAYAGVKGEREREEDKFKCPQKGENLNAFAAKRDLFFCIYIHNERKGFRSWKKRIADTDKKHRIAYPLGYFEKKAE